MNIPMWRKQVIHDDKVNLPTIRNLHSVQPVKLRYESVGVVLDMLIVVT